MAWENFISSIESKYLMEERDKALVLAKHCNSKYKGDLKKKGDRVKILGVNSPVIYSLQKDGTYTANQIAAGNIAGKGKDIIHKGIPDAHELGGYETELQINQIALWHFLVGDLDEKLSDKDLMGNSRRKQGTALADVQDSYVAKVLAGFTASRYSGYSEYATNGTYKLANSIPGTETTGTSTTNKTLNIADLLDMLLEKAKENNFSSKEKFVLECSPKFYRLLNKELRGMQVNVDGKTAGKTFGGYGNIEIFDNNSMKNILTSGDEYVFFRTREAVAFVDKVAENEAYRPEKGFSDAIKGYNLYDCGITDPKGLIVVKVSY